MGDLQVRRERNGCVAICHMPHMDMRIKRHGAQDDKLDQLDASSYHRILAPLSPMAQSLLNSGIFPPYETQSRQSHNLEHERQPWQPIVPSQVYCMLP